MKHQGYKSIAVQRKVSLIHSVSALKASKVEKIWQKKIPMRKMKPLEISQRIFTWIYLCSPDEAISPWRKIMHFVSFVIVFLGNFTSWAGALAYIISYVSIDLEGSLYAVFQLCAVGSVSYILIAAFFLRFRITAIFKQLTEIYDASTTNEPIFRYQPK